LSRRTGTSPAVLGAVALRADMASHLYVSILTLAVDLAGRLMPHRRRRGCRFGALPFGK
jgi:hypothetical protein